MSTPRRFQSCDGPHILFPCHFTDNKILILLLLLIWLCGGWWQDHLIFIAQLPSSQCQCREQTLTGCLQKCRLEWLAVSKNDRIKKHKQTKAREIMCPKKSNSWQSCSCHKLLCSIFWVWHPTTETRVTSNTCQPPGEYREYRAEAPLLPLRCYAKQ